MQGIVQRGIFFLGLVLLCSCNRDPANGRAGAAVAIQVAPENSLRVETGGLVAGPVLSGELQAQRTATVRAKVGGTVTEVRVEEGQSVKAGALLARIESRTLEDTRNAARAVVATAEQSVAIARTEVERDEALVAAGAIAQRQLDQARASLAGAETQLANARAALLQAEQQVGDTVLRAPFSGIVGQVQIHQGDVVAVGAELLVIIDPASMRLAASVSSADISRVHVGDPVEFTIRGYAMPMMGSVERIAPVTDAVTRQVQIFVTIPADGHLTAGLFAEGRIAVERGEGPIVPIDAINTDDSGTWVLRVRNSRTERVPVSVGIRDPLTEQTLIREGVSEGDILLRGTAKALAPGTLVEVQEQRDLSLE